MGEKDLLYCWLFNPSKRFADVVSLLVQMIILSRRFRPTYNEGTKYMPHD